MTKKSQTSARRKNTQVGPQIVNFYNHGTVSVDARKSNSTSPKTSYSYCTINCPYQSVRPYTLRDGLNDSHPILGMVSSDAIQADTVKKFPPRIKRDAKKTIFHKHLHWVTIAAGVAFALVGVTAFVKYINN